MDMVSGHPLPIHTFQLNWRWWFFFVGFFFGGVLGFELRAYTLSHSISPFFFFNRDRVSWTICSGWLQTSILLISTSWIARITDVSHQRLAWERVLRVAEAGLELTILLPQPPALALALFFWEWVLLYSPGWPRTCCVAQPGLEHTILLPLPSEC
jgi:hypothetical protein